MRLREEILLGKIAIELGLLRKDALDKAIAIQEEKVPSPPLGEVLVENGFLKRTDLDVVLAAQRVRLQKKAEYSDARLENILFGRLVVHLGLVTEEQVNECLRIQAKVEDEVEVRLGEILVKKGYMSREAVRKLLSIQNKKILYCRKCFDQVNVVGYQSDQSYQCPHCGGPLETPATSDSLDARGTVIITKEMRAKLMREVAGAKGDA